MSGPKCWTKDKSNAAIEVKIWTSNLHVHHRNIKWTIFLPLRHISRCLSPLLLVVCVAEPVKLGRGMWMRPTMLGCSSATFPPCIASSSSSPLSHTLLSDGYSYVLLRLDSLKEIVSCNRHRQKRYNSRLSVVIFDLLLNSSILTAWSVNIVFFSVLIVVFCPECSS